jgi:Na+-transporting NADH:ubiquinone oxidoreductase subunit NqrD
MDPNTINEIGNVAKHAFVASVWPASPPIVKIIGICAPKNACAKTKIITLRLATVLVVSVMYCSVFLCKWDIMIYPRCDIAYHSYLAKSN